MTLAIGPLGLAAWFGLLVTALNMMPVGQLDGGHVVHALGPRLSHTDLPRRLRGGACSCSGLRPTWLVWTILLWLLGRRPHPPTMLNTLPVGRARLFVGLLGFAVFAVCFTPNPVLIPGDLELFPYSASRPQSIRELAGARSGRTDTLPRVPKADRVHIASELRLLT